jgi:hypothetical protein
MIEKMLEITFFCLGIIWFIVVWGFILGFFGAIGYLILTVIGVL